MSPTNEQYNTFEHPLHRIAREFFIKAIDNLHQSGGCCWQRLFRQDGW